MKPSSEIFAETDHPYSPVAKSLTPEEDEHLREILKRCPASTYQAARLFRQSGDPRQLPTIINGIIERFVEPDLRAKLKEPSDTLALIEDLGLDSLCLMEITMLVEDTLAITIKNEELRSLRTLGDIKHFTAEKVRQPANHPQPQNA